MKSAKALLTVVACMIGVGNCQSQCDWSGKFIQALQQRGGVEEACKMLTLPSAEFDRTHLLFEHQTFQKLHLLQLPSIQTPMQEYANRYLRHAGIAAQEEVNIVDDPQPNAFATGQMVFLHSGIVDWYLRPDVALMKLGFSRSQANQYLSQISGDYPGKTGLLAVLAHETAHNVLGHPDAQPVANSCNEFINAGVSRVKSYEEELATGRKPSQVKELLKGITLNYAQTFVDSQSQQRVESEADAYGAYLVWKETGDPQAMAKSLKWLADFPGILPNSRSGVAFEALCSNHPNMLQRVDAAQNLVVSLTSSGHAPQVRTSPLPDTLKRYQQFEVWYLRLRIASIEHDRTTE